MARDRILRKLTRERFVVTLKESDATIEGLLLAIDAQVVELADAHALKRKPDGGVDRHKVDGRVYIARADVAYMQRPEA